MQKLKLCVDMAKENPHHLDLGMPLLCAESHVAPEVAAAMAAMPKVTRGLVNFELKPPGLTGAALFEHMVQFRSRHCGGDEGISAYHSAEVTTEQLAIIAPSAQDLTVRAIIKDAGGTGATKKLARRKLNNTGAITNHCGLQNQPERVKKLLSALELTASIAEISALTKASKVKDKSTADAKLLDQAPAALAKFNAKSGDVTKLQKKEICAIAFRYFGTMLKEADAKPNLVTGLQGLVAAQPEVLAAATERPAATPTPATRVTGAEGGESAEEEEDYSDGGEGG